MRPDIVTFWHGPLDALRRLCLRSQVAAGHKVTVYSFDPLAQLPEASAMPRPKRSCRMLSPKGCARPDRTACGATGPRCNSRDFFRMRLMAQNAGLWLDADVLLLKPVEIDPAKPYFAWERPRQLGNSVLYLPPGDPIVTAFDALMQQDELTPDWLALRHRLTFGLRKLRGGSHRLSDIRVAIYGPAALTALARRAGELQHALPKKSFYAVHAEPKLFFEPSDFSALIGDPEIIGFHISPKGRGSEAPIPGSLYAWAAERFGTRLSLRRALADPSPRGSGKKRS